MAVTGKVMTADEAVRRYIEQGSIIGLGGQNINRCPMALVHEIIRQGHHNLTVVGCNLSLPLDMLAAAELVASTEQGSGNLERYGSLFTWRRLAEQGEIDVTDYSHLGMATRFLGGSLGVPYLPTRSMLGSDVLDRLVARGAAHVAASPWGGEPVALLRSLMPDVSIIHASRADQDGNVMIDGVTSHEVDMVKASRAAIVTVEEIVPTTAELTPYPEAITISGAFVDSIVAQPFGAFPTSVYKRYDYDGDEVEEYQRQAKSGARAAREYLDDWVIGPGSFDAYLEKRDPTGKRRESLEASMRSLL